MSTPLHGGIEFRVQPNAARRRGWCRQWPVVALVGLSLLGALRFAWLGYWFILAFSVLELSALVVAIWYLLKRADYVETIHLGATWVEIQQRQQNRRRCWQFPRGWAQLRLQPPRYRGHPQRLLLGVHDEWVEVGRCLTDSERCSLAAALSGEMRNLNSPCHLSDRVPAHA